MSNRLGDDVAEIALIAKTSSDIADDVLVDGSPNVVVIVTTAILSADEMEGDGSVYGAEKSLFMNTSICK